ncbi:GNAT family N-acetyltransferase [Actinomadura craniellae]|uniref:GNAT family N-acetyltransferase n=1 Tax=Actinomadura craniellae TaxID=2231787 RepID=A0A365GZQ2_9ACTN|nr:GNAT family N-acetyltransferase [Actinomadura craniellae]RAY12248.1 GNAT family N-acetyltransferase [Actinomadura craniellae]
MDGSNPPDRATIRLGDRPGDLGTVVAMHGVLYGREEGMDQTMEAYVATGLAEYALARARSGDAAGRLWVAETGTGLAGSIGMTASAEEGAAQLRWFLLDPSARGQGLGRRLRDVALDFARAQGYRSVFLWTIAGLAPAHHLYKEAGFTLTTRHPVRKWGIETFEERYDLPLT